ncbi:MAG: D-glycero-alpha-D-manno-heptose-1,7-bisphosphate 7-phosphatase, partial [Bdellovibrionota bacterium]
MKLKGAFFLDRDGTINVDHIYISDPDLIELIPGSAEAIARVQKAGFLVVVVTNQSGVGRGFIEAQNLPLIHSRLDSLLAKHGAHIDDYRICIHHPEDGCDCRKPNATMVKEAAQELGIDLSRSVFVGDRLSDVATGPNSGCRFSILVRTGKGLEEEARL